MSLFKCGKKNHVTNSERQLASTRLYSFWVRTSAPRHQNAAFISTSLLPTSHQGWSTESASRTVLIDVRNHIEVKQLSSSL